MYRRYRERRRRRNYDRREDRPRRGLTSAFRSPGAQIGVLLIVALVVFLLLQMGGRNNNALASTVSVNEAYDLAQKGAFVLDVRTVEEWN
jgi:hypothetical protein